MTPAQRRRTDRSEVIRTVLGDIAPNELGPTDYHEHLFQRSPQLLGEDLDDPVRSREEAARLHRAGAAAMVEATPVGLGREPDHVADASRRTGLHIVHVTGWHREAHYSPDDPNLALSVEELSRRLTTELVHGMEGSRDGIRAGALKAAIGFWSITAFERRLLEAVGGVAGQTGAPVMVHLEYASAAHEALDLLAAQGCATGQVVLAHADRNPDPTLHAELIDRGAFLGYDGAARHQYHPESTLIRCLENVITAGGGTRILLGGDVARRSRYAAYDGLPGLAYLFQRYVPRLRRALGDAPTNRILIDNPAEWLCWSPPEDHHELGSGWSAT